LRADDQLLAFRGGPRLFRIGVSGLPLAPKLALQCKAKGARIGVGVEAVVSAWRSFFDPRQVMAGFARGFRGFDGNIFVSQKLWHFSHRQRVHVLLLHRLRGIMKNRLNVVLLQVGGSS
jgi:hypothetical protein